MWSHRWLSQAKGKGFAISTEPQAAFCISCVAVFPICSENVCSELPKTSISQNSIIRWVLKAQQSSRTVPIFLKNHISFRQTAFHLRHSLEWNILEFSMSLKLCLPLVLWELCLKMLSGGWIFIWENKIFGAVRVGAAFQMAHTKEEADLKERYEILFSRVLNFEE